MRESNDAPVEDIFELFTQLARKRLSKQRRIYTDQLVVWLMVLQQLFAKVSIREMIPTILGSQAEKFLGNCKRVRERKISIEPGAFSQARTELAPKVIGGLIDELSETLSESTPRWNGKQVFIIDGTTLRLQPREALARRFPPRQNQLGTSIFPLARVVVAHDAFTGLAQEPELGDSAEPAETSEPRLAAKLFQRLEPGSIVLGDRAYGLFSVAWNAKNAGLDGVFRIQQGHLLSLISSKHPELGVYDVQWKVTKNVLKRNPNIPPDACLSGRLIVAAINEGNKSEFLYIFTTLQNSSVREIVELYGKRWQIETDLRHFKCAMENAQLSSTSLNMIHKELLAAVLAYNLTRAVILLASEEQNRPISEFSFKVVRKLTEMTAAHMLFARTEKERNEAFTHLITQATRGKKYRDKRAARPRLAYRIPIRYSPRPKPAYAA